MHIDTHFSPTSLQPADPLTKGAPKGPLLSRTTGDQVGRVGQPAGDAVL